MAIEQLKSELRNKTEKISEYKNLNKTLSVDLETTKREREWDNREKEVLREYFIFNNKQRYRKEIESMKKELNDTKQLHSSLEQDVIRQHDVFIYFSNKINLFIYIGC